MKTIRLILLAGILSLVSCLYPGEDWGFEVAVELSLNEKTCERLVLDGSYQILKGSVEIEESGYFYSASKSNPDLNNAEKKTAILSGTGFTATIEGLTPNTTYYVRPYVRSDKSYAYGEVETFRTDATTAYTPALSNAGTSAVGVQRATVTSVLQLPNDSYPITEAGFCYSDTAELPSLNGNHVQVEPVDGSISYTFSSLKPDQKYYVRAYAINALGTFYGSSMEFSTASPVSLGEVMVSNLSSTGFNVTAGLQTPYISEGFTLVESGFCYSGETSLPTVSHLTVNSTVSNEQISATVLFGSKISYFVRAYAKCSNGEYYYGKALKVGDKSFTVQGISFDMVAVNGGSFSMGATDEQLRSAGAGEMKPAPSFDSRKTINFETQLASITQDHSLALRSVRDNEKPVHTVSLSPYYIGKHEVTQQLWQAVMGYNNSGYDNSDQNPVENISWYECLVFIDKLKALTGAAFVLPTEAQWEYAARGGALHEAYKYAGSELCDTVAWTKENSSGTPHVVGSRQANALGIYDMSGNISEKCYDWYAPDYYSNSHQTDPSGPAVGTHRVQRGGDYYNEADWARVSSRSWIHADSCYLNYGFRLALREGMTLPEVDKVVVGEMTVSGNTSLPVKASFRVTVNSRGSGQVSEKGICISSSESPDLAGTHYHLDTIADNYEIDLYMKEDRSFYVRSYAISEAGVVYGEQVAFTTPKMPVVSTVAVTDITASSATCGGIVSDDGGLEIMARGVVWSTSSNPTIDLNTKTSDGTGPGSFISQLTDLSSETDYYVRAYATNAIGTTYGEQLSFSTLFFFTNVTNPTTGKIWMDRNLGASQVATSSTDAAAYGDLYQWGRGTDGHEKRTSSTTSTLATSDIPGHGNFITKSSDPYEWRIPQNNNLWQGVSGANNPCPSGYRLPTYAEWGDECRSWSSNNAAGAFASPLKLPVAGGRLGGDGSLFSVGSYGSYWSSTVDGMFARLLSFDSNSVYMYSDFRAHGYSVRCLKGDAPSQYTPTLTTSSVVSITQTSAESGGNISSDGGATISARGVCWSTNPNPTTADNKTSDGSGTGEFTSTLTNLSPGTTYYVRAFATNSVGTAYGEEKTFKTDISTGNFTDSRDGNVYQYVSIGSQVWMAENLKYLPSVVGPERESETTPYCYVYGYWGINVSEAKATDNYQTYGVLYNWPAAMAGSASSSSNPSGIRGVCPAGWHLPSDAEWTVLTDYLGGESIAGGKLKENGTSQWKSPNTGATNETGFTALPGGYHNNDGTFGNIGDNGYWWCATEYNTNFARHRYMNYNNSNVNSYFSNKDFGYSVRCVQGDAPSSSTPNLTTSSVVSITQTTAVSGGNISSDGGSMVFDRGVCWNTNPNPTIADNKTSDGIGSGEFTSTLTNLSPGTTYYLRAYATNSVGTAYGMEVSFETTVFQTPTLTTSSVISITQTTAESGGNISSDGGATVSARGVCWSTDPNPTIADNKTLDGTGTGEYTSILTNLSPGTTYYVRAFATNSVGTTYGEDVLFKTAPENSIIDDRDGNVYQYVTIGSQVWMTENLKYLPVVHSNAEFYSQGNSSQPGYGVYGYDGSDVATAKSQANYTTYGVLYNWYAVDQGNICPSGWHVSTDSEWTNLTQNLGGESVAGGKLKETGTNHWNSPNEGATNETGFTALPGGSWNVAGNFGVFNSIGNYGAWWSRNEMYNSSTAWLRGMNYNDNKVKRGYKYKGEGKSVRCVRD